MLSRIILLSFLLALAAPLSAADSAPATVTDNDKELILDNGVDSLTVSKRGGQGTSIKYKQNGRTVELANGRSILYFDVALLKRGTDEITLGHAEAQSAAEWKRGVPGQVKYDALRLEVDPNASSGKGQEK